MPIDYRRERTVNSIGDNVLLTFGAGTDAAMLLRSTALAADAELTGVIVGTSDHPGVAANSLLIANQTADGDIMLAVQSGGNTTMSMLMDASAGSLALQGLTLAAAAITGTTIDATTDFTIGTTVITDDTITFGGAGDIVQSAGTLTVTSAAGVGLGRAHNTRGWMTLGAGYTAASSTKAHMVNITEAITGHTDDVQMHGLLLNVGFVTQTQTASIADIAMLRAEKPSITDNLTGDITRASAIMIDGLSTVGESNYGLLIDGGATDGENYIGLAMADLDHGLISGGDGPDVDSGQFFSITNRNNTTGCVQMNAYAADAATYPVLLIEAYGGTAPTTHTYEGVGLIQMNAYEHDGSNAKANIASDGNVFGVGAWVGGALRTVFLVDEDGDLFADGSAASVYDDMDDLSLVSAVDKATGAMLIDDEWADYVKYNEKLLVEMGILGASRADGGLVNVTRLQRLHNGALRQLAGKIESLTTKLELTESKLAAIGA